MPTYYIMELGKGMAETVAPYMPAREAPWLTDEELRIYASAFERNGFQGGLQWYRCAADATCIAELQIFSGRTIGVPSLFIAGANDWGVFQKPGDFEAMQTSACTRMLGCELVDGAGHWVQQEQPTAVNRLLLDFLQAAV